MATLNPYLNFKGEAEEAFKFYKSVFGGEFSALQRFKDTPEADKMPAAEHDKIMHIALPIGNGVKLMASDTLESMGQKLAVGNNFYLSVNVDSKQEADRVFNGLSKGGKVEMPMQKMFWGEYFGMFADKFGIQWMVSFAENPPQDS
jgi:PhnB protein